MTLRMIRRMRFERYHPSIDRTVTYTTTVHQSVKGETLFVVTHHGTGKWCARMAPGDVAAMPMDFLVACCETEQYDRENIRVTEDTKFTPWSSDFKEGDWVAEIFARYNNPRPRLAKVKETYPDEPDNIADLVMYAQDGKRLGRVSPACGGPTGYEPCCEMDNWVKIEKPNFPLDKYEWGHQVKRL